MRYFRLFDDLAPDGDLYRVSSQDVVEYFNSTELSWEVGGWHGLEDIQDYVKHQDGARFEWVNEGTTV